jgi:hypothetical protein
MVGVVLFKSCCDCCRAANAMFCSIVGRGECGGITSGTSRGGLWSTSILEDSGLDSRGRRRRRVPTIEEDGVD